MSTKPSTSENSTGTAKASLAEPTPPQQPLPLPEPTADNNASTLNVSTNEAIKLDHLGPMIVNRDGTLSRIANWEQMTDLERRNTVRILSKRNQLRLEKLNAEESANATQ